MNIEEGGERKRISLFAVRPASLRSNNKAQKMLEEPDSEEVLHLPPVEGGLES